MDTPAMTPEQKKTWEDMLARMSPILAELAKRLPPWNCYTIKVTGEHAHVLSYVEPAEGEDFPTLCLVTTDPIFGLLPVKVWGVKEEDVEVIIYPEGDAPPVGAPHTHVPGSHTLH